MRFKRFTFLFAILFLWVPNFTFARALDQNTGFLTFQTRVEYQRAIEELYWRHRIWPKENPGPKPPLEKILPDSAIISKVEDYLRKSNALDQYWKRPVTPQQLQAEMDRMVKNTKQPQLLKEIFSALNNDPHVIAECLARPALVDRLIHNWYANDEQFHGYLKARAQSELWVYTTVETMKLLSGKYYETVWKKKDVMGRQEFDSESLNSILLDASEWKDWLERLQRTFSRAPNPNYPVVLPLDQKIQTHKKSSISLSINHLSGLQEDADRFYVMAILEKDDLRMRLATVEWEKRSFEQWWKEISVSLPSEIATPYYFYSITAPRVGQTPCTDDTWKPLFSLQGRTFHSAIWTGSEMIVWGGISAYFLTNTGDRYNPSTDTWALGGVSLENAPESRVNHSAVWTGTEMIIWGGNISNMATNKGGRYNPSSDTWAPNGTNIIDAPSPRGSHTAIWTGSEMIIWGGTYDKTGGRYDPSTDSWAATSIVNTPGTGTYHTAVWTGEEMIVWGGGGGRYNPSSDTWAPNGVNTIDAPSPRGWHTAVWTGTEMIIWGGAGAGALNTGGRYNPSTDTWNPGGTSTMNAPSGRYNHTAIWTGTAMIIWGGRGIVSGTTNTGGRYDPLTDSWASDGTSTLNAPSGRYWYTAIWTGTEMIVWGGDLDNEASTNTGGRYDPSTNTWSPGGTTVGNVPSKRRNHTAIWTGAEMIIWGGRPGNGLNTGGRYNPATDTWSPNGTSEINAPSERGMHTAIWTGTEMIIWGGGSEHALNTGSKYDPATDSWSPNGTSQTNAPSERLGHTAIWTGTEMIIWGGQNDWYTSEILNTGGRYDPLTNTWRPEGINMMNAPGKRAYHTAIWTGTEMIIWGGSYYGGNTGGRYDPLTNTWRPEGTNMMNAPGNRVYHTAIWTGTEMIVWGGFWGTWAMNTGGRYDPITDTWISVNLQNAPDWRAWHTAVWTGTEMIVWGGYYGGNTGGRYDPLTDSWLNDTSLIGAPTPRQEHTAIWTGTEMIIWGGISAGNLLGSGGRYCVGPNLQISDTSMEEGKKGGKTLKFVVSLSTPVDFAVKVDYTTADGTATEAGNDYVAKSGTKRIRRGETTTTIKIKVKGDKVPEVDEIFTVNLTNAVGVGIADPQGVGTIMNDD